MTMRARSHSERLLAATAHRSPLRLTVPVDISRVVGLDAALRRQFEMSDLTSTLTPLEASVLAAILEVDGEES